MPATAAAAAAAAGAAATAVGRAPFIAVTLAVLPPPDDVVCVLLDDEGTAYVVVGTAVTANSVLLGTGNVVYSAWLLTVSLRRAHPVSMASS